MKYPALILIAAFLLSGFDIVNRGPAVIGNLSLRENKATQQEIEFDWGAAHEFFDFLQGRDLDEYARGQKKPFRVSRLTKYVSCVKQEDGDSQRYRCLVKLGLENQFLKLPTEWIPHLDVANYIDSNETVKVGRKRKSRYSFVSASIIDDDYGDRYLRLRLYGPRAVELAAILATRPAKESDQIVCATVAHMAMSRGGVGHRVSEIACTAYFRPNGRPLPLTEVDELLDETAPISCTSDPCSVP